MDAEKKYENLKIGQLFRWTGPGSIVSGGAADDIGILVSRGPYKEEINILWSSNEKIISFRIYDYETLLHNGSLEII